MQKQVLIIYQIISLIILKGYYIYFAYDMLYESAHGSGDGRLYFLVALFIIFFPAIIANIACIATTLLCTNKKAIITSYFFALFTPMCGLWLLHSGWYHYYFYLETDLILHVLAFVGYILFYNKLFNNADLLITDEWHLYLKKMLILSVLIMVSHVFCAQVIDECVSLFNIIDFRIIETAIMRRHIWCLICILPNLLFVYKSWNKLALGWYVFCMLPNIEFLCRCIFAVKSAKSEYTSINHMITPENLNPDFITSLTNYLLLALVACCITIFIYIIIQRYVNNNPNKFNILTLIKDTIYVLLSYFIINTYFTSDNILQLTIFIMLAALYIFSNKNTIVKTSVYTALLCVCWGGTLIQKSNIVAHDWYFWAYCIPIVVGYYALDYCTQKGITKKVGTTRKIP